MKAHEFIKEAKMDPGIRKALAAKGYKFLGKGQDQDAYLAPDGTILKIFGTDRDSSITGYSEGQQSFVDFANYCMKNSDNPFLPQFGGFERFEFGGKYYLQIRCERLFGFDENKADYIADFLEGFADNISRNNPKSIVKSFAKGSEWEEDNDAMAKFILFIGGEEPFKQLLKAMEDLNKIADRKDYGFDLHSGNFMLGSDGHIVINDPFFTGTWR